MNEIKFFFHNYIRYFQNFVFDFQDLGENIYSLSDVVQEIRDKATKERLQVLPYELKLREPSTEAIRISL